MKHIEKLQELIHSELADYSYFQDWELHFDDEDNNKEYYTLTVKFGHRESSMDRSSHDIRFRCGNDVHPLMQMNALSTNPKPLEYDKIEVELGEGGWVEIAEYNWTIKYFWMALLSWD